MCIQDSLRKATTEKIVTYDPNGHTILPREIVEAIKEKKENKIKFHKTGNPIFKTMLNKLDKEIKTAISQYKQQKWEKFCSSLNNYQVSDSILWKKLRAIETCREQKPRKIPLLKIGQSLITDPVLVANTFAENLEHVFENSDDKNFDLKHKQIIESKREFLFNNNETKLDEVHDSEVTRAIKNLRSKGAPGEDGITNQCLKNLPSNTVNFLTIIFNYSLKFNHIPSSWKNAIIIMLPKPMKDANNPENYRPISLLNCLSKLLERIIMNRLQFWIKENDLIAPEQCGFRNHRQTRDHILRITQNGLESFNMNERMGAIFIDIEKAFDKVWHDGLLHKLNELNIPNYLGKWIQNYLSGRTFQVRISNSFEKIYKSRCPPRQCLGACAF